MNIMITCPNCHIAPKIDIYTRDRNKCIIKCCNCRKVNSALIGDLIYSKSEYNNFFVPKCSRKKKHESTSIPNAEKICEKCSYYFCKSCGENHESAHEDDDEPHKLKPINGIEISKCKNHKNIIESFCKTCQSEICSKCLGHEKHELLRINEIINYPKLNVIDNNISKATKIVNDIYKKIKENAINKITKEINDKISQLQKEIKNNENFLKDSIQKISDLYSTNIKINNNLIEFIKMLKNNYTNCSNNFCVFFNLINNAHFNFVILKNYDLNDTIEFFKNNYILDIKETKNKIKCIRCYGEKKVEKSASYHEWEREELVIDTSYSDKYGIGNEPRHLEKVKHHEWKSDGKVTCPLCKGEGSIIDIYYEKCTKCFGNGVEWSKYYRCLCGKCKGAGYFLYE